jgi:hypothetical protein
LNFRSILRVPEHRPGTTILCIAVVFLLAYGASLVVLAKPGGRIVRGDALGHYVQLRSVVFDRDLEFSNDYTTLLGLERGSPGARDLIEENRTPTGHFKDLMPVGPALLWAPLFLIVAAGVWILNLFGAGYPLDGYAAAFQAVPGLTGVVAAALGTWFAYLTAARLFGARVAIWATLTIWLASSAVYYSVISPSYSHAASMLAVSAFWLAWIRTRDRQDWRRYGALGALAGVAALMRWQDAILLLVPAIDAAWHGRIQRPAATIGHLAACGAAAVIVFSPQMIVWKVLYGRALTVPQGPDFMLWGSPALISVLFSKHGLISWTPVIAPALVGLGALWRRDRLAGVSAVALLAVSWYVNAAVADWWAGEAFGARRFLSCYPIFVLGLAALYDRHRLRVETMAGVLLAFAGYTGLLLLQYQTFMHGLRQLAPYPEGGVDLWLRRFRVPVDLAARLFGQS